MVIDSHALLWWLEDRPELSSIAADQMTAVVASCQGWRSRPVTLLKLS
jgi:PIN domain nuclease of toxin-antitoxin system